MTQDSQTEKNSKKEDVYTSKTKRGGIVGLYERLLRKYRTLIHVITLVPMYALAAVFLGFAVIPSVLLFSVVTEWALTKGWFWHALSLGFCLAFGYFLYGFTLIFVIAAANRLIVGKIEASRGQFYSANFVRWYAHNGLTYIVRYTFLEFVTPTPISQLFYRMMGMKIGENVQINSTAISDPSMIELEDKVTIGGSATIVAHYGQAGYLVISPVRVRKGATVGLRAIIMGGADIGENAKILPNSVVMPKTVIPAGETWGGVPAQKISLRDLVTDTKS